jgi:hypothetical protein
VLGIPSAVRVLAVHDLRLVGVQFEAQGPKPLGNGSPEIMGLFLCATVG